MSHESPISDPASRSRRLVHRYTKFPNLHDVVSSASEPFLRQGLVDTVSLPSQIKKASIILSWAFVLRGYSGESLVVFDVDQATVAIDFDGDALEEVQDENVEGSSGRTALYFTEV